MQQNHCWLSQNKSKYQQPGLGILHVPNNVHLQHQFSQNNQDITLTFGVEPRAIANPSPDIRMLHGEYLVTELYEMIKYCHQMAEEMGRENNDDTIEKYVTYYNTKVRLIS